MILGSQLRPKDVSDGPVSIKTEVIHRPYLSFSFEQILQPCH